MKALKTIALVAALGGCATPQEFMSREPDAIINLAGSPQTAALCLARNLENYAGNMIVNTRPAESGWEVIARLTGEATTLYAIAQLQPEGTGSRAQIWAAQHVFTGMPAVIKGIVKGC
jgi:hypothetical protein